MGSVLLSTPIIAPTNLDRHQILRNFCHESVRKGLTRRRTPLRMGELIETINPIIRGWGNYYCRSQVRKRFHQLDGWIVRRLWSHRAKRWRNTGWKEYPTKRLLGEFKLVNLVSLIPSLRISRSHS